MEVITREPRANAVFLGLPRSGNHHDPWLFGAGTAGGPKRRGVIGLYRLARQPGTIGEPAAARQALPAASAPTGLDHGPFRTGGGNSLANRAT
jgi:hypothetical protein